MAIPTWTVGQVLTADDVNNWLVPLHAYKAADQSLTSSTTLTSDNDLLIALAANSAYRFECWLTFAANVGADIKWTWTVPAGAALSYQAQHNEGGSTGYTNSQNVYADTDVPMAAGGTAQVTGVLMTGHLTTSTSTGNIRLKWAQNSSNAAATHVRVGSYLHLDRVG
jgi:hypothetical protein